MLKLLFDFSSVPRFSPSSLLGSQHQPPSHHLPHIKGDFDSTSSGVSRKESRQSKSNCSESGKFEIKGTCIGNVCIMGVRTVRILDVVQQLGT